MILPSAPIRKKTSVERDTVLEKATDFLCRAYDELDRVDELPGRIARVREEVMDTGTWSHMPDELSHGARMAWRNSNRCIGRIFWKTLKVVDARTLETEDEVFEALQDHVDYAFNGGEIRSVITIFRAQREEEANGPRILNHQLIRYAGHRQPDGSTIGDPAEVAFTDWCRTMGHHFKGTPFDILPLAIQWPGREKAIRPLRIPDGMRVAIRHPEYEWFGDLGLEWYAVPVISGMMLEIGGIRYTAAPFNGWYMGTEIGSRNFGDAHRYNMLPEVGRRLGLNLKDNHSLWKDRALVELNRAVLHSFRTAGITISNHHDAAEQFVHFEEAERRRDREVTADWAWITPPMSASATPVFHREYDNTMKSPNFLYQDDVLHMTTHTSAKGCPFHAAYGKK